MVTRVITCYQCDSENIVKNGKAPNGKQKYLCHDCGRQSREGPGSNAYPPERREEILRAYQERSSLRGLARTFGVSRNTVTRWLKKGGKLAAFVTNPASRTTFPEPRARARRVVLLRWQESRQTLGMDRLGALRSSSSGRLCYRRSWRGGQPGGGGGG